MKEQRIEEDSMGKINVPADRLWGAQTQRSLEHFRISQEKMPAALIRALALTKRAAAEVNVELGLVEKKTAMQLLRLLMKLFKRLMQLFRPLMKHGKKSI